MFKGEVHCTPASTGRKGAEFLATHPHQTHTPTNAQQGTGGFGHEAQAALAMRPRVGRAAQRPV